MENQTEQTVTGFPTAANAEGWYYENEGQKALGIETRDDDGSIFKRVSLSGGRTAVLRELTGKEMKIAGKIAGRDQDKVEYAMVALASSITDKDGNTVKVVAEDLDNWKARDINRLVAANNDINF